MNVSYETTVTLRPLNIRKDNKNYILEDEASGEFYEMPDVCVDAIEMLKKTERLNVIETVLKDKYPNEDIDIIEFVKELIDLELVKEMDGKELSKNVKHKSHTSYKWIPVRLGYFFFNRISSKLYIALLALSIGLLLFSPELFPQYKDLFVFDLMLQNVIAWIFLTFLLVLIHEFGHVLALRSEGLPAKIELGHRLFFIVLETDMSQVYKLHPENRNKLYMAGMYFDMVVLFISLTAQLFITEKPIVTGLLKLVELNTFLRLVYQASVFMKTDLYYVLENKTGSYNLMENGRNYLSKWLPFIKNDHTTISYPGEEKIVRRYAFFYLVGVAITIAITFYYYIPQLIFAINQIILLGLTEPFNSLRFWDSAVFLLQIVLVACLLIYSWSKKYRLSR